MIRVITVANVLGNDRQAQDLEYRLQTPATLIAGCRHPAWAPNELVSAVVEGRRLTDSELLVPLWDTAEVHLIPDPQAGFDWVYFWIAVAVAAAGAVISYQLAPRPSFAPPSRDDESSPTYSFGFGSEYRAGLPIPIVLGEHDVGGTIIHLRVRPGATNDQIAIAAALCQGPVHSIGGQASDADNLGGIAGGPVGSGKFPENVRLSGNTIRPVQGGGTSGNDPGAYGFVRLGQLDQRALPKSVGSITAFDGVRTTLLVQQDLNSDGQRATAVVPNLSGLAIATIEVVFTFPAGLYAVTPTGQTGIMFVEFKWEITLVGGSAPIASGTLPFISHATRQAFSVQRTISIPNITLDEAFEVSIIRTPSVNPPPDPVSACRWRQIVYGVDHQLAYPGVALMGIVAEAGDNISGDRPDLINRVKAVPVRVWDESINQGRPSGTWIGQEFVPYPATQGSFYELPPAGDLYAGIWSYPPGRNPAWQFVEVLTNRRWGLGKWVTDDQIDWPTIRDWADWCDRSVVTGSSSEAGQQCCLVIDAPTPAWEALMRVCAAGRAVPVQIGDRWSVRYNYAAAHGRGANVVPAKSPTQLITSANVRDFQVTYLNTFDRPAVLTMQIVNEEKQYTHDPIRVEDPNGSFNNPLVEPDLVYRKDTIELFGITRRSQAEREGLFHHAANRLIRSEVEFEIGPEALAATIGDVIAVQHFAMQPFDEDAFAYRVAADSTGNTVKIDHAVTLDGAKSYGLIVLDKDRNVLELSVPASTSGTFDPGDPIPITTVANLKRGAPVGFGIQQKITRDYEIRVITLARSLARKVVAHEYHPEVYADPDVGEHVDFGGEDVSDRIIEQSTVYSQAQQSTPTPLAIRVDRVPETIGEHLVSVGYDPDAQQRRARVYLRRSDTAADPATLAQGAEVADTADVQAPFEFLGETTFGGDLRVHSLEPHTEVDLAVVQPNNLGAWPRPTDGLVELGVLVDEFPNHVPPPVTSVRSTKTFEGTLITWEPVDFEGLLYYELRATDSTDPHWLGARLLGRTQGCSIVVPPLDSTAVIICARARNGQYSPCVVHATPTGAPQNETDESAIFTSWALTGVTGTTDMTLNAGLTYGKAEASATMGSSAERRLVVGGHAWWADSGGLLDDLPDFDVESGEGAWWQLDGRESSVFLPGCDFHPEIDDIPEDARLDDVEFDRWLVGVGDGQAGHRAQVRVLVNYDSAGWEDYVPRRKVFNQVEVRLEFHRADLDLELHYAGAAPKVYTR